MPTFTHAQLADIAERVGWTAAQAFGAQLIASGFFTVEGVTDLSMLQKAAVAGIAAALAVVKGFVASVITDSGTAATLPPELEPASTSLDGTELSTAERNAVRAIRAAD